MYCSTMCNITLFRLHASQHNTTATNHRNYHCCPWNYHNKEKCVLCCVKFVSTTTTYILNTFYRELFQILNSCCVSPEPLKSACWVYTEIDDATFYPYQEFYQPGSGQQQRNIYNIQAPQEGNKLRRICKKEKIKPFFLLLLRE